MGFSWPFRRHTRWQKQLDAYIDGELRADDLRRFEAHLRGCARCEPEVAARRELKRMAVTLPQLPAPRSFRITPGMLVEAPAQGRSRGAPVVMRLAQVTAGLATVAFAAVLVTHLAQGGDTNRQQASGDDDAGSASAPEAVQDSLSPVPVGTVANLEGSPSTALPEVNESAVSGAGAPAPSATPVMGLTRDDATKAAAYSAIPEDYSEGGVPPPDEGVASSVDLESDEGDDDGGLSGFVVAEVAFAGLASVAAVTWLVTRRRQS